MKKILSVMIFLLFIIPAYLPAMAEITVKQGILVDKFLAYPQTDWDTIYKENKDLVDEELVHAVRTRMNQLVEKGKQDMDKFDAYMAQAFVYGNLADYMSKKRGKPEQNRFHLAQINESYGRLSQAIQIVNLVTLQEPKNIEALIFLARLFQKARMPNQAMETYQSVLKADKHNPEALYKLGLLYLDLIQIEKAMSNFKTLVKVHPHDPYAAQAQKYIELYEGKVGQMPKNRLALQHFIMGERLSNNGKYQEAAEEYKLALELEPGFAKAYIYLGETLMKMKKLDSAVEILDKAIALSPQDPEGYHFMGLALEKQYNYKFELELLKKAIGFYEKALEVNPKYTPAREELERAEDRMKYIQNPSPRVSPTPQDNSEPPPGTEETH